jgi:hypothetical protein
MFDVVRSHNGLDLLVRVFVVLRTGHFDDIVVADGIDSPYVVVGSAAPVVDVDPVLAVVVVPFGLLDAESRFRLSIGQRAIVADSMGECQAISVG